MEIIPVIDICRGQVVHAVQGQRAYYQPVQSRLCPGSDPVDIVQAIIELHPFNKVYIADLDAIGGIQTNSKITGRLCRDFPDVCFWIDEGNSVEEEIIEAQSMQRIQIVGSETGIDPETLYKIKNISPSPVLSLDFMDGKFVGNMALFLEPECWPDDVIVMNLSRVGSGKGPDLKLLDQIIAAGGDKNFYLAGGIRDEDDIQSLAETGIAGVLIATTLHNGKITGKNLRELSF